MNNTTLHVTSASCKDKRVIGAANDEFSIRAACMHFLDNASFNFTKQDRA